LLDQTHLLNGLVDDLRTLALADAGQLKLNLTPTDPAVLVHSVVAQFAPQAEAKHIRLRAEVAPNLPSLSLDSQRIAQVLGNLLGNALRHTPTGGRVECRVTADTPAPREVTFTISDTGSGIPSDALPHLFERFYRVDRSRSRADGGTGLGLAIAKQLVEAHGGRIGVTSAPGQGTQVTFTLPVS
jgi:signal transduction histidine kinase